MDLCLEFAEKRESVGLGKLFVRVPRMSACALPAGWFIEEIGLGHFGSLDDIDVLLGYS